MRATFYI